MQRQLRLGDILDDYCPRERRLTNHAVVAMVGADVKQTRCTTCDAEHEYKHARVPRQRRKADTPAALYSQVVASGPKRHEHAPLHTPQAEAERDDNGIQSDAESGATEPDDAVRQVAAAPHPEPAADTNHAHAEEESSRDEPSDDRPEDQNEDEREHGPVHRPLIRASLPRPEGHVPPPRPVPEFTIRQPGGRPGRFRPRGRGAQMHGRSNGHMGGGGPMRGGMTRQGGGRPQGAHAPRGPKRHGPPHNKRSK